jgi:hypothetical protein
VQVQVIRKVHPITAPIRQETVPIKIDGTAVKRVERAIAMINPLAHATGKT